MTSQQFSDTPRPLWPPPNNRPVEEHESIQKDGVLPATMSSSGSAVHRRGPWSQQEDSILMNLIRTHGPYNWVHIASCLNSRTPKQCRERFHQNLKPSLNHTPITTDEGKKILELVNVHGKRWAEIARHLDNRSDNAVKNWWNGHQNRRKRRSQEPPDSRYEDGYSQNGLGPGGQMSPSMANNAEATPRAPNLSLPPPNTRASHDYYQAYGRRPQWDQPLPSPISSEGAESDLTSNYTTSPHNGHMAPYGQRPLPRPGDLPPVRPSTQGSHTAWDEHRRLPALNNWSSNVDAAYHTAQRRDGNPLAEQNGHAIPRGDLPTAPNSPDYIAQRHSQHLDQMQRQPVQSAHAEPTYSDYGPESSQDHYRPPQRHNAGAQWPAQPQEPASSAKRKDPRLSVASLLTN